MKKKILLLNNYDSFIYNILQLIKALSYKKVDIFNNNMSLEDISSYNKIILSPGPGVPDEAHIMNPLIKYYANIKSIFGICLGQQAIALAFGGKLIKTENIFHGISSRITIVDRKEKIFTNIGTYITGGRYHSWIVSEHNFPLELKILARGPKGEIMALSHKTNDLIGIQFHPESILTPNGIYILYNWLHF